MYRAHTAPKHTHEMNDNDDDYDDDKLTKQERKEKKPRTSEQFFFPTLRLNYYNFNIKKVRDIATVQWFSATSGLHISFARMM